MNIFGPHKLVECNIIRCHLFWGSMILLQETILQTHLLQTLRLKGIHLIWAVPSQECVTVREGTLRFQILRILLPLNQLQHNIYLHAPMHLTMNWAPLTPQWNDTFISFQLHGVSSQHKKLNKDSYLCTFLEKGSWRYRIRNLNIFYMVRHELSVGEQNLREVSLVAYLTSVLGYLKVLV